MYGIKPSTQSYDIKPVQSKYCYMILTRTYQVGDKLKEKLTKCLK